MILINVQNSIGASYNVNCQYNTTICQNQKGKQISSFSFGLENNMLFNITQNILIGINSGILFTNSTFTDYSSLNSTTFADAKISTATTPYMGLSLRFNF